MPAIKRNFILSSGIGISADNIYIVNATNSSSTASGALTITGGAGIGQSVSIGGRLQLFSGSNYTAFVSSASGNTVYTLPATTPATGTSVLQSTSAGVLSWVAMTAGSSSGTATTAENLNTVAAGSNSNHHILFSPTNGGSGVAVSSDAGLLFNPASNTLTTNTFSAGVSVATAAATVSSSTATASTSTGALVVTGGVGIGQSISIGGRLQLFSGSNYTAFVSSASGNTVYTLPATTPATGTSVLQSDSTGTLTWVAMTASGSGSGNTAANVNVNSASTNASHFLIFSPTATGSGVALSSESALVYNPSTDILSVSGLAVTSGTSSTSSSTGSLIVSGGAGVGGSLFVGTTIGVNTGTSGLLFQKLVGGNYGAIYSSGVTPSATNYTMITDGTSVNFNGTGGVYFNISNSNKIQVTTNNINIVPTAGSTSTTTGSLTVGGGVGIGGSIFGGSTISAADNIEIKSAKELRLNNSGNTFYTGIKAGANASNTTYTLPVAFPGSGTSVLQSDTSGTLTWVAMTSSSSGNTAQNIAINSAGNTNASHTLLFTPSSLSAGSAVSSDSTISFNPSTEILSVSGVAVTSGTASTNTTTGALVVRGGLGVTGQLTFATASLGFTGITSNPSMSFIGNTSSAPITMTVLTDNSLNWEGSQGSVFSIDSNLSSGEIFSVSDISGLPIISASAGQTVNINEFGGYTQIGNGSINSSSTSTGSLVIAGGLGFTGNAFIGGTTTITNGVNSSSTGSGSLVVRGGVGITGNAFIGGTSSITNTTASTNIGSGALVVSGGVGIGQSASIGGRLQMFNGANYTAFVSSASGNTVYTLPATSPATGSSVLISSSAGVLSWASLTAVGYTASGAADGTVQFKSGSGFAGTNSLFFDPNLLGLRVSGFPGGNTPSSTDAVLKLEATVGSFNGNLNGTYIAVNAPTGFTGDLMNLQVNAVSRFKIDSTGAATAGTFNFSGTSSITNGLNSSSTTTGTLTVAGGAGITGNAFIGGTVNITNTTLPGYGSTTSGALVVAGGVGIGGSVYIGGQIGVGGTLDYNAPGNVAYFAGNSNSYTQVIVHNHNAGNNASSDYIVSNDSTTDTTFFGDFGMNSSGWAATTSAYNTANAVYLASNSGDLAIGTLTTNPIRFFYNNGTSDAVVFGATAATVNYGTNSTSTTSGALQVKGGLGITGNAFIGGTTSITNTTASTSIASGALVVSGGAGIAQTLFVGGSISNANYFYSGGNNFTKSGQAQGDILLDNNQNDTPGVLYYYRNNTNFGTDVFATGTGSTRYRIVKDLNESGGSELWSIDRTGVVTQTAWAPGEIIKMTVLVGADLTGGSTTTISTSSDTDVASYSYTPVSSNSYLVIEFTTRYSVAGAAADDFVSRIAVDGAEQSYNVQVWINGAGGGTRSGTLFPLMARYTNSSTSAKTISATVRRGTTDDNATVYKDTTTVMKITEIGR